MEAALRKRSDARRYLGPLGLGVPNASARSSWWPDGGLPIASVFLHAIENHHQEPLDALPDAGILGFPITRDVETFDLRVSA